MEFVPFKKKSLSDEVKNYLYEYIRKMDIEDNTKLPPEDVIAQSLGVSRVTVRKALTDLEQEGVIFRIHGKGTFVNREALQLKVNIAVGNEFEQMIIDSGYEARVEVVNFEIKPAGYKIAEGLQIKPEDLTVAIEKIFYADEHAAIFCIDTFPLNLIEGEVSNDDVKMSIFELLRERAGKIITWDKIEAHVSTKEQVSSLHNFISYMENSAFLVFETVNYDQDNNPVLYVTEFHDTNYIRFNMIRQKNIKYSNK